MISTAAKLQNPDTHCALCGRKYGRAIKSDEHIVPMWLQHRFRLLTKTLNIPNLIRKTYKSIKLPICKRCNNERFGSIENRISSLSKGGAYDGIASISDLEIAVWIGKITFLLCRKSGIHKDFRQRNSSETDTILPVDIQAGLGYLAIFLNAYALQKGFYSCYLRDAPASYNYGPPFSLYRFRIDNRTEEGYDFSDNPVTLGASIRFDDVGLICLFDGGLHRHFQSSKYAFIGTNSLHPIQFRELAGLMYYDMTVLHPAAARVQYYWNTPLKCVIAETQMPRSWNPFLRANHDPDRLLDMVSRYTHTDPDELKGDAEGEVRSTLVGPDGTFFRYPVTEAEVAALPSTVRKLRSIRNKYPRSPICHRPA